MMGNRRISRKVFQPPEAYGASCDNVHDYSNYKYLFLITMVIMLFFALILYSATHPACAAGGVLYI